MGTEQALTPRQLEVVRCVGEGLTNYQVAKELGISEWTVVNHMRDIMRRLGCTSRVQVARWAWANPVARAGPEPVR